MLWPDRVGALAGGYLGHQFRANAPVSPRATGPFDHWTPLAGYLLVILLVGISLLLHGVDGVLSRPSMLMILALDALGLLLSAELSAMVALAV